MLQTYFRPPVPKKAENTKVSLAFFKKTFRNLVVFKVLFKKPKGTLRRT